MNSYYEYLRSRCSLTTSFKGKTTVVAFFMDKDVDDRLGLLIRSPHVIYTDYYDVENHVFNEGDVAAAVGAACSLPPNWCRDEFGEIGQWQKKTADLWFNWVRLCFAAKILRVHGAVNYGRISPLNSPSHCPSDPLIAAKHEQDLLEAARAQGVTDDEWASAFETVDAEYSAGEWDKVFKGKWYAYILGAQVQANCPYSIDTKHLNASLVKHAAGTMNFRSAWSLTVQGAIRSLACSHGLNVAHEASGS
ncbi:hypothetical protein AB4225_31075 [Streptomyces sp. 2RAF24]|uniref:hypothetical protein n=1 Tax=Streptomyces sp. 2RAF24 TaxID=3232997 RepID=UPI003F9A1F26